MNNKIFLTYLLACVFIANACGQLNKKNKVANNSAVPVIDAKTAKWITEHPGAPVPYVRPTPIVKINNVGVYPNIKKAQPWDGREKGNYNIKIKVRGLKSGDTMYLADYHIDQKYMRDTAVIAKDGWATFTGNYKLQRGFYLGVMPKKEGYFEFLIDDDQDFSLETDTAFHNADRYIKNMKITGSLENQWYKDYQMGKAKMIDSLIKIDGQLKGITNTDVKAVLNKRRDDLMQDKNRYDSLYISSHPHSMLSRFIYSLKDPDFPTELPTLANGQKDSAYPYRYYKQHYFDFIDFNEDMLLRAPLNVIKQKVNFYFDKLVAGEHDSCIRECEKLIDRSKNSLEIEKYLIWLLSNRFESSNILGQDKVYCYLVQNYYATGRCWWSDSSIIAQICDYANKSCPVTIGNQFPELELKDNYGNFKTLFNIEAPYKVFIFWDPTCGHCKEVMPKLLKAYNENNNLGWKVVALSSGDKDKEWKEYLTQHPEFLTWTHVIRSEVTSEYYKQNLLKCYVHASPTIFVMDQNNKIVANKMDVDKLAEFIEQYNKMYGTAVPIKKDAGTTKPVITPGSGQSQPADSGSKSIMVPGGKSDKKGG